MISGMSGYVYMAEEICSGRKKYVTWHVKYQKVERAGKS
jgi:hypothetical protein